MYEMASNWQITLKIIWFHLKRDGKPWFAIAGLLLAIIGAFVWIDYRITSPEVSSASYTGTIETAQTREAFPSHGTGSGYSYRYGIRLDANGSLVFASQTARRPMQIGEKVSVIRSRRENGLSIYRFADDHAEN